MHGTDESEVSSVQRLLKYTNEELGTDKSVLLMEVSLFQVCLHRGIPL